MKKIAAFLLTVTAALIAGCGPAITQATCPAFTFGVVLTPAQWQACFDAKQPALGYTPVNRAGDAMTGKLTTVAPTTASAGLNMPPGVAPTAPVNGDVWTTSAGMYARISGVTIGPFGTGGGGPGVLPDGEIFVGNSGNTATPVAMSGDATIINTGAVTVSSTGGVPFAASATTDATDAANISSGTLAEARLPLATSAAFGAVRPDNATITISGGVLTAVAGMGTVNSGTAGQLTYYATSASAVSGNPNANISAGALTLGITGSVVGQLKLAGNTSGIVTIGPAAAAGTWALTLPSGAGVNGAVLTTDGSGGTAWIAAPSGNVPVGGTTGQVLAKASGTDYDTTWQTISGAGTVTSVALSGGTTGLTTTGSPITTSGTITLTGTLNVSAGGTGQSTLASHGVLIGAGTSGVAQLAAANAGTLLGGLGASSDPAFTATPTLGVSGTTLGTLTLAGSTSGSVRITPQAAAGSSVVLTAGNTTGTIAAVATSPLSISATTGTISITGAAGRVLAGSGPAFTATPTLGASGTTGILSFAGATSGVVNVTVNATAGSWTFTLPAAAGSSGQFLTTDGAGVTTWSSGGSGTVTLVNSGTGLSGGPISSTGTLALASVANNRILGNVSGSSAAPVALTPAQVRTMANYYPAVACDGSTDDTSAINALLASGGLVNLPPGTCIISSALSFPTGTAATLSGAGPGVTIIKQTSTSANGVTVAYSSRASQTPGGINNLSIVVNSSSSGNAIDVNYANAGWNLQNLFIQGFASSIRYRNSWYTQNNNLTLVAPTAQGILLDECTDANCQGTGYFNHISILCSMETGTGGFTYCAKGVMGHGVHIKADHGSLWTDIEIWGSTGPAFLANPATGFNVLNQWMTNIVGDTANNATGGCVSTTTCGDGIRLDSTGGGLVSGIFCSQCWGVFNQNSGMVISGTSGNAVSNVKVNGGEFTFNAINGIVINGAKVIMIEGGTTVAGNSFNAAQVGGTCNTTAGVSIGPTVAVNNLAIIGNYIGNVNPGDCQHNSVTLGAVANNTYNISNNQLNTFGSGGAAIVDSTTGSPSKIVTPNL